MAAVDLSKLVKEKRFWVASFLVVWAAALQGHMMWMQRQDAFKHKFGLDQADGPEAEDSSSSFSSTSSYITEGDLQQRAASLFILAKAIGLMPMADQTRRMRTRWAANEFLPASAARVTINHSMISMLGCCFIICGWSLVISRRM